MPETPARPFSRRFASALRSYMEERKIRQRDLSEYLDRSSGYVSEHLSGQRAVDTDMLDAVAHLAGTDTRHVLLEVARRIEHAEQTGVGEPVAETAGRIVREARTRASEQNDGSDKQAAKESKSDTPNRTGSP